MSNHFNSLLRSDLRIHRSVCCVERMVNALPVCDARPLCDGDVVLATHDSADADVPFQGVIENYDYASDTGISWWCTPLMFGPVRELA